MEGVLGFAEYLMANAARVWMEATLEQRQRIQSAILPEGLPFDGRELGTAPTYLAFMQWSNPEPPNVLPETGVTVKMGWRPHRDSNPGFSLERAAS